MSTYKYILQKFVMIDTGIRWKSPFFLFLFFFWCIIKKCTLRNKINQNMRIQNYIWSFFLYYSYNYKFHTYILKGIWMLVSDLVWRVYRYARKIVQVIQGNEWIKYSNNSKIQPALRYSYILCISYFPLAIIFIYYYY